MTSKGFCCNEQPYDISVNGCCSGIIYSKTKQICCNNGVATLPVENCCTGKKVIWSNYSECCGTLSYTKQSEKCCDGTSSEVAREDQECCGRVKYNVALQGCCDNQLYFKNNHSCCSGQIVKWASGFACCGTISYNTSNQK